MYSINAEEEKKEILKRYRGLLRVYKAKSPEDKKLVRKAFDMAVDAHKDMRRKSGEPYIYHPISVATIAAGEIGLGYDKDRDLVVLVTREILLDGDEPEDAAVIRYWCTRSQARALARWSVEVVKRGRPLCPQCGQPIEPGGHFCPKKNGYRH